MRDRIRSWLFRWLRGSRAFFHAQLTVPLPLLCLAGLGWAGLEVAHQARLMTVEAHVRSLQEQAAVLKAQLEDGSPGACLPEEEDEPELLDISRDE